MTKSAQMEQLHATCVALDGKGVLLLGESGSGKSDLALRLIDRGAQLVADDRVDVRREGNMLIASAPEKLRGLLEMRGIGIRALPFMGETKLQLAVQLVAREVVERLPESEFLSCLGLELPLISLHAFDLSTDAKIRFTLKD